VGALPINIAPWTSNARVRTIPTNGNQHAGCSPLDPSPDGQATRHARATEAPHSVCGAECPNANNHPMERAPARGCCSGSSAIAMTCSLARAGIWTVRYPRAPEQVLVMPSREHQGGMGLATILGVRIQEQPDAVPAGPKRKGAAAINRNPLEHLVAQTGP